MPGENENMSAGTIKLTNGSTAVVGTSTTFTTDLKSGDVITTTIGSVFYTLFVDTVTSATAATITDAFTGPTTTGAAYVAVPAQTMSRVPAQLAILTQEAVRRVLQENVNWQAFYSGTGDITVTLPDGTPTGKQVPGPSWAKLAGVANTAWIDRGQLAADANLNTMNPATTEGEWSKSSSTGLTTANGYPVGAGVGTLKVNNGGRYQGQQVYTQWNGLQWVRALTATWNGTDGPWSSWAIATGGFGAIGNVDLNTLGPDYAGSNWSLTNSTFATAANNYPVIGSAGIGFLEIFTGGNILTQRYTSRYGRMFTRTLTGSWNGTNGPWGMWYDVGYQSPSEFFDGDLNTATMPGLYNVTTATSANLPLVVTGVLRVYWRATTNQIIQEYTCVSSAATYANRHFKRTGITSSGVTAWSAWDETITQTQLANYLNNNFSIGGASSVMAGFDWQTFNFVNGANYSVTGATMVNAPSPIDTATSMSVGINVMGLSGDPSSTTAVSWCLLQVTLYVNGVGSTRRVFNVIYRGMNGARNYTVFEYFGLNSTLGVANGGTGRTDGVATNVSGTVAIANGGTGGTTPATARTGLGLKGAAVLDVGTVAGTVAAGDDSRLATVGGKTGGSVSTTITLTGAGSEIFCHQSGAQVEGSNTKRLMVHGYVNATQYSWLDSYLTPNNMTARIVVVNGSNTKTFNFLDSGNGVCDGTWVGGSDIRFKYNIKSVGGALGAVLSWRGVTYVKKDGAAEVGLIAQDVEKDCPEAIINGGRREFSDGTVIEDFKMLNTAGAAAAYHTEAIKTLFGLVKLAIDDPEAARAAIAAIESEGLVSTQQDDSQQSDEVESNAPTSTDDENQSDTQQ